MGVAAAVATPALSDWLAASANSLLIAKLEGDSSISTSASSASSVTINTLYAPMRRYPVRFSLLLYYDATLPMLD